MGPQKTVSESAPRDITCLKMILGIDPLGNLSGGDIGLRGDETVYVMMGLVTI